MRSKKDTVGQDQRSFIETARRAQIVQCAIETIADIGYGQASLAQIASRAGISKGIISYYFESKEALMEQIVTDVYTRAVQFMLPQITAQSGAADMLRVFIESNFAFIGDNRKGVKAIGEIIGNLRRTDGTLRFDSKANEPNIELIEWILNKGQQDGDFRAFDVRVMALTIRAALDMAASQLANDTDATSATYAQELVPLFHRATQITPG